MRVSTVFSLAVSIFAARTVAITGDEGVAEMQKLATATTEYNNQLSMVNDETGLSEGYRASIGLIQLKDAFAACIVKLKEGVDPDPSKTPPEVSSADADRILAEAKTFLDLLDYSLSELQRIHGSTTATPHFYDIQSALDPIISAESSSLASISGNLQIWFPIDKWTPTEDLFNPTIAKLPPIAKTQLHQTHAFAGLIESIAFDKSRKSMGLVELCVAAAWDWQEDALAKTNLPRSFFEIAHADTRRSRLGLVLTDLYPSWTPLWGRVTKPMFTIFLLLLANTTVGYLAPNPSGKYNVTLTTGVLIDYTRDDPYAATPTPRALMLSVFQPTRCSSTVLVPYMPNKTADYQGPFLQEIFNISADLTPLFLEARLPVCSDHPRCSPLNDIPILLFSPGYSIPRLYYNVLATAIASEGFIVITIDHPGDADIITYPDGHAVYNNDTIQSIDSMKEQIPARVADVSFVIDQLRNATAIAKLLPQRGHRPFPTDRVAMLGHSLGGVTAVIAASKDSRLRGAINMDGTF
ncbi:hypothetical protein V491_07597, partial [Pseudogymnoascus sp. VKM F-3775]